MPFENSVDVFDLRGDHLKEVFEHAAEGEWHLEKHDWAEKPKFFIQTSGNKSNIEKLFHFILSTQKKNSGAKVVYNMTRMTPDRVASIEVIGLRKNIPRYEPIDPNKYYRCISSAYMTEGGDGFHVIPEHMKNHK